MDGNDQETTQTGPSNPRPFQFSLRTLLIATFVFGCIVAPIGNAMWESARRRYVAQMVSDTGGTVHFQSDAEGQGWFYQVLFGWRARSRVVSIHYFSRVTDQGLALLSTIKELFEVEELKLVESSITDAGLAHLASLSNLKNLDLHGTSRITDTGLAHLKGLTNLRTLDLSRTKVTGSGFNNLSELKKLEVLKLISTQVTDSSLIHLRNLTRLRILDLRATQVTEACLEHVLKMKDLEELEFFAPISAKGWTYLCQLPQIQRVSIQDNISALEFAQVRRLQHLRHLTIFPVLNFQNRRVFTDADLANLQDLNELEWLNLAYAEFTDEGVALLRGLTKLKSLSLSGVGVTNKSMDYLKEMPKLEYLWLNHLCITDVGIQSLQHLTKLSDLRLNNVQITDEGVRHLKAMPHLRELSLRGTQITDALLVELSGMSQLKRLELSKSKCPPNVANVLSKSLPKCAVEFSIH